MKNSIIFTNQFIKGKQMVYHLKQDGVYYEKKLSSYGGKHILNIDDTNDFIKDKLLSSKPCMICRFGAVELSTIKTFDFELKSKYSGQLHRAHMHAGIFPETVDIGNQFKDLMINSISQADLIGIWPQPFEEYYIQMYGNSNLKCTWLKHLEPWNYPESPWSRALKGKKVLIIHPFADSIIKQYKKREKLFPDTDILPEFRLQVVKSVQTAAGGEDARFKDWFQAYQWMKEETVKRDFDVAVLGCGAYGFPLAAEIKKMGKQAIHFGGGTQILFGIYGERWNSDEVVNRFKNETWVRPQINERPADADKVENGCYW